MVSRTDITTFHDPPPPPGESPWVGGYVPAVGVDVVEPDPAWPLAYDAVAALVREALGLRVLLLQHVGSTSVPDLPAKPILDVDLVVADPEAEPRWLPPLEAAGFVLRVREPWWHGHRCLRLEDPAVNLHVFGPESPEPWKHRVFRDWLRADADDRELYARAKRGAAAASNAAGEHTMAYNARKEAVVRDVYGRAFAAAGLTDGG